METYSLNMSYDVCRMLKVNNTFACFCSYLPGDLKKKQLKTVLILRNPKDTAVSYYNHMHGLNTYCYTGEWKNWLVPYLNGNSK